MRAPWLALACWAALSGCTNGLDIYSNVHDLRVLSLTATYPEIANDSPVPLATSVLGIVLDPRGGPLEYTWSLCPIQSDLACDDFDDQLSRMDPNTQAIMRKLRAVQYSDTALPGGSNPGNAYSLHSFDIVEATEALYPNETYSGTDNRGPAQLNLTAFLWDYFLRASLFNQGQGAWPSVILDLKTSHGDSLRAEKRIVLGVLNYATIAAPLLATLGVTVCPPTGPPPPGCLTLPPHAINNNPAFTKVQWAIDANGPWQDPQSGGIHVQVNQQVLLRPVLTPDSYEDYTQIEANVQTQTLAVRNATEDLAVSWFCEAGTLLNPITWPKFTVSLLNQYTAPSRVPNTPNGVDFLWLVVRDLRGGEATLSVPMVIDP